jgi:uncharacterized protein (DUF1697 family)
MNDLSFAFVRGTNVGGRRITGPELVDIAGAAGFDGAASYQASGNLVLPTDLRRDEIENRLSGAFADERGWDVDVFVRTLPELQSVIVALPFTADQLHSRGKPQVGFAHDLIDVSSLDPGRDLLAASKTELYWVPHTSVADADLEMSTFARLTGAITIRTLGTIERLVTKFGT